MTPTRRAVAAGLSLATLPVGAAAQIRRPLVIAHRGASGERPEHTLAAYRLAIEQGADFIEPDLVASKDGVLVCRHDTELSATTNVGSDPRYAGRSVVRMVEGRETIGWFAEDFNSAEIASMRARERLPDLRPGSAAFDGREAPPTFQQVVDLARSEARRLGRPIGLYPELKAATELTAKGLDTVGLLLEALNRNNLPNADVPVIIQCFEAAPLRRLKNRTRAKLAYLTQVPTMVTFAGLREIATYADGVGAEKSIVTKAMVDMAHAADLTVHAWTFRAENQFLPADLRSGGDRAAHGDMATEIKRYLAMGVDGVFSDFPGMAVAARG